MGPLLPFLAFFPTKSIVNIVLFGKSFSKPMITNPRTKRILSISLLVLGGMLMFFAPENIWIGVILFTLGVGVEIAGLVLGHRNSK